jgi:hypothetical protein
MYRWMNTPFRHVAGLHSSSVQVILHAEVDMMFPKDYK